MFICGSCYTTFPIHHASKLLESPALMLPTRTADFSRQQQNSTAAAAAWLGCSPAVTEKRQKTNSEFRYILPCRPVTSRNRQTQNKRYSKNSKYKTKQTKCKKTHLNKTVLRSSKCSVEYHDERDQAYRTYGYV
jgi:hypothetical protein